MNAETMFELRKFVAPEFIYGTGALTQIGRYAKNFGAQKALVVTDPGVAQTVWLEKALKSLNAENIPWAVFKDITPNPKDHEVAAGVQSYRDKGCNVIVAVGGGRTWAEGKVDGGATFYFSLPHVADKEAMHDKLNHF